MGDRHQESVEKIDPDQEDRIPQTGDGTHLPAKGGEQGCHALDDEER